MNEFEKCRNSPMLASVVAILFATAAGAQEPKGVSQDKAPKQWAILIGVQEYLDPAVGNLPCINEDVRQLYSVLCDRAQVPRQQVLQLYDATSKHDRMPLRENLLVNIPAWLQKVGPRDRVLVYFSGHGFPHKGETDKKHDDDNTDDSGNGKSTAVEKKLYLAPRDCQYNNLQATGISVEWVRDQLQACRASFKLLVLDTCHAGNIKGAAAGADLADKFDSVPGIVTLASCKADESSYPWLEKGQSLFTYWLVQGLKGHADRDGNSEIDIHELFEYVERNVKHTAENRFHHPQTPRRVFGVDIDGTPAVLRLPPQSLDATLADMAEQLAWGIEDRRIGRVGMLEFTTDTKEGELLGGEFGPLGRYCAEELRRRLAEIGAGKFSVVGSEEVGRAVREQRLTVGELRTSEGRSKLASLGEASTSLALVEGTLRTRDKQVCRFQCKLVPVGADETYAQASGTAWLNEHEYGMTGHSFQVRPGDMPAPGDSDVPPEEYLLARLDSQKAHPFKDGAFPFRVRLMIVTGKNSSGASVTEERKGTIRRNETADWEEYLLPVHKGEQFEIWVDSFAPATRMMRLLVDGLNTQLEKEPPKGLAQYPRAKRVNLAEARSWVLDPAHGTVTDSTPNGARTFAIRGFVTETGADGKVNKFEVVDAARSLAARQHYTEQLGLITAAFYFPKAAGSRGVGVGWGEERDESIIVRDDLACGDQIGVVHLRLVDAEELR